MMGRDSKHKGEEEAKKDDRKFRPEEEPITLLDSVESLGDEETAERNAHHKDRDDKADLMVKIAIKSLKGEDDGKVEHHICEAGCEDGKGKRVVREKRFFQKKDGKRSGQKKGDA